MPIDANIALQVRPLELPDTLAKYAQMQQIQGAQKQNRLSDLMYEAKQRESAEAERTLQRENLLRQATRDALNPETGTLDPTKYRRSLGESGDYSGLHAFDKDEAAKVKAGYDNTKAKREADKEQLLAAKAKLDLIGQVAGAAKDERSYAIGLESLKNSGIDISQIPAQYDPAYVAQAQKQAMTATQQIENVWKQKGYDLQVEQFGEAKRHNRVGEANAASNTGAAWANVGLRKKEIAQRGAELANESTNNPVLGVPQPAVYPWSNQSSSKDANKVKLAEANRGSKEIEKDVDAARAAAQQAQDAKRFLELNGKVGTGGVADKFGLGRAVQGLGSDYAEMESITARLAPANRAPGSGATSDYDAKQFERATVGVDKPKATNTNIANALLARSELMQDYADFRQTYLEQNGTLQGADRHWKEYTSKNPIFDPAKAGTYSLNPKRSDWRSHFAAGSKGDKTASTDGTKPSAAPGKTVKRTGTINGRKVIEYSDGSVDYAN